MKFRPLWEANPETFEGLRRVIMSGYYREGSTKYPKVGEAFWGCPDGGERRWVWAAGGDVINPLGFIDFPDFPVEKENDLYVKGGPVGVIDARSFRKKIGKLHFRYWVRAGLDGKITCGAMVCGKLLNDALAAHLTGLGYDLVRYGNNDREYYIEVVNPNA